MFRERYGRWPSDFEKMFEPAEPTVKTVNWIRSRQIAFAKARKHG